MEAKTSPEKDTTGIRNPDEGNEEDSVLIFMLADPRDVHCCLQLPSSPIPAGKMLNLDTAWFTVLFRINSTRSKFAK